MLVAESLGLVSCASSEMDLLSGEPGQGEPLAAGSCAWTLEVGPL